MPHVANPQNFTTEVFVVNQGDKRTTLVVEAYDQEGCLIETSDTVRIEPHGGWAQDVGRLFLDSHEVAYLKIIGQADAQLIGQALFSTLPEFGGQMGGFVLTSVNFD